MTDLWDAIGGGLFGRDYCSSDLEPMMRKRDGGKYCPECRAFAKRWRPGS